MTTVLPKDSSQRVFKRFVGLQDLRLKLVVSGLIHLPQDDYILSMNSVTHLIRQSTTLATWLSQRSQNNYPSTYS